ncbi:hypothetical protein MTsN2n4_26680 [Pseudoalteromonas sp. MTN2-4]
MYTAAILISMNEDNGFKIDHHQSATRFERYG